MNMHDAPAMRNFPSEKITRTLGWVSIGIGLAELLAPRAMARTTGMDGRKGLLQAYGVREIATGIGLLTSRRPAPWLWGRVVGDALDMATLGSAMGRSGRRGRAALALAAVAGVTALDLAAARTQSSGTRRRRSLARDYGDRSGFPRPAEEMRGIGRGEPGVVHLGLEPERPTGPGSSVL